MDIKSFQERVREFTRSRFPNAPSHLALIKVQEEVGELAAHYIGRIEERVGKEPCDHQAGVEDSVADIVIALAVFCCRERIDLDAVLEKVWGEVSQRKFVSRGVSFE